MILFLDDDVAFLDDYRDELEAGGHDVTIAATTDEALRIIQERGEDLEVVVLDMMMPPGKAFEGEETEMGIRTGELFYRRLRSLRQLTPVILFTNRNTEQLDTEMRGDPRCRMFMKEDLLPGEFVKMIDDVRRQLGDRSHDVC